MMTITTGTEKQNAWANEIITKPAANVEKRIAEQKRYIDMGVCKESNLIPALRAAVDMYNNRLDEFSEMLTACYVIDNREIFIRLMWQCIEMQFKAYGLNTTGCQNWANA